MTGILDLKSDNKMCRNNSCQIGL